MTTPIFSIPELAAGVLSPEMVENEKTRREEFLIAAKVLASNQNAPAGGESEGEGYIVGSTPSGSFAGFSAGDLALLMNGAWEQIPMPSEYRSRVWSIADGAYYTRQSGTWTQIPDGLVDSVNGATGTVVLDPDDLDDTATTNKFTTAAEITKLAGIETAADVTDEANVVAALSGATLTDVGTPASTDKVLLLDASDGDNLKRANFSEFAGSVDIDGLTENAVYEAASDTLVYYDVSAGANRKIKFENLPGAAGGDQWSDPVDADIVPGADSTYDLGSSANRFALAFVDDLTITTDIDLGNDLNMTGSITIDGDIVLNEKADHSETPAAGKGYLWVKSDAPSSLQFTDDAGSDHNLIDMKVSGVETCSGTEVGFDMTGYDWIEIEGESVAFGTADRPCIVFSNDGGVTDVGDYDVYRQLVEDTSTTAFSVKSEANADGLLAMGNTTNAFRFLIRIRKASMSAQKTTLEAKVWQDVSADEGLVTVLIVAGVAQIDNYIGIKGLNGNSFSGGTLRWVKGPW